MKTNSIVFKLFIITTVFFVSFLGIAMIVQTVFFEDFYLERKIKNLEKNIEEFNEEYLSNNWNENEMIEKANIFAEKNNSNIAILDKNGILKYMNSYYMTIFTQNEEEIIIPLNNFLYDIDFEEFDIGLEITIEGIYYEDENTLIPLNLFINGINLEINDYDDSIQEDSSTEDESDLFLDTITITGTISDLNIPVDIDNIGLYGEEIFWDAIDEVFWEIQSSDFTLNEEIKSYNYIDSSTGTENIILVKPIIKNEKIEEIIITMSSLQPVGEAIDIMKEFYLYGFIIIILIVIILSFIYSKMISKPMIKLNNAAIKMAELDFNTICDVKSNDEIGSLSNSLNSLSYNLKNTLDELNSANEKLIEDIEKEKELENMRKEFISSASHELKTPLGIIKGFAEGIKDGIYEDKKEYYLDVILDEIENMNELVLDLLDLSKLEAKSYKLNKEKFNIDRLVNYTIDKFRIHIEEKDINIIFNKTYENIIVYADKRRIEQVIINLFSNAVRHTERNGIININININSDNEEVNINIENSGPNVPKEEINKIWDRFYRAEKSRDKKSGGTGLGLAIVKNILELHQSKYGVKNTENGVLFYFSLSSIDNLRGDS